MDCVKRRVQRQPFKWHQTLSWVNINAKIWSTKKEHLLISGPGKYPDYNHYRVTGMAVADKPKGAAQNEAAPIDLRSLLPWWIFWTILNWLDFIRLLQWPYLPVCAVVTQANPGMLSYRWLCRYWQRWYIFCTGRAICRGVRDCFSMPGHYGAVCACHHDAELRHEQWWARRALAWCGHVALLTGLTIIIAVVLYAMIGMGHDEESNDWWHNISAKPSVRCLFTKCDVDRSGGIATIGSLGRRLSFG